MNVVATMLTSSLATGVVSGLVATFLAFRQSREAELSRKRDHFAKAYQSVTEYKEMPYAIRRRRLDIPGEERVRISEAMRSIQADLSFYEAWTQTEDPIVGHVYSLLVRKTREIAGGACRTAWMNAAPSTDEDMNVSPSYVDLSELASFERTYLDIVRAYTYGQRNAISRHEWRMISKQAVRREIMTLPLEFI